MSQPAVASISCKKCGKSIEVCEGCQESDCASAICYDCLNTALGRSLPQPHAHGG
jgi:hypothetical protein